MIHDIKELTKYFTSVYAIILKGHVYLMDFNPFGLTTDPLMFTWQELQDTKDDEIVCLPVILNLQNYNMYL